MSTTNSLKNSEPASFLIDGVGGFAGGDDFVDAEPVGDELGAGVAEDSALKAGLGGDEECCALGGEGVGFVARLWRGSRGRRGRS